MIHFGLQLSMQFRWQKFSHLSFMWYIWLLYNNFILKSYFSLSSYSRNWSLLPKGIRWDCTFTAKISILEEIQYSFRHYWNKQVFLRSAIISSMVKSKIQVTPFVSVHKCQRAASTKDNSLKGKTISVNHMPISIAH